MVEIQCQCGTKLRLGDEWAGKQGRCPRCQAVLDIPAASPSAATGAPPSQGPAPPGPAFTQPAFRAAPEKPAPKAAPKPAPPQPPAAQRSGLADARREPRTERASKAARPEDRSSSRTGIAARSGRDGQASASYDGAPAPPPLPAPPPCPPGTRLAWHWLTVSPGILLVSSAACVFVLLASSLAIVLLGGRGGQPSDSDQLAAGRTTSVGFAPAESAGDEDVRKPPPQTPREAARADAASPEKPPPLPAANARPPAASSDVRPPPADPARSPTAKLPAPTPGSRKAAPRELTGISRRYDDMECARIQQRHGRRVPSAATILEVDGKRLAVVGVSDLQASPFPYLFLPRGEHAVRWREGERAIEVAIADDLGTTYADMRTFFAIEGNIRSDELFSRGARTMDVHRAPFLLNFTGAAYAARNEWQAAERRFRRALRVNPLFSPAHLNLACCLAKRGQKDEALRELYLAQAFNVGDVFGLQPGIVQLGRELGVTPAQLEQPPVVECRADVYVASEPLREEDRRLSAILTAASKYAVREEDCGKILNNLAVHFADTGRPELALDHFRSALEAFKLAGPDRFELARRVLSQMAATCRRAGYVEADEYAQMQNAVMP